MNNRLAYSNLPIADECFQSVNSRYATTVLFKASPLPLQNLGHFVYPTLPVSFG